MFPRVNCFYALSRRFNREDILEHVLVYHCVVPELLDASSYS